MSEVGAPVGGLAIHMSTRALDNSSPCVHFTFHALQVIAYGEPRPS